MSGVVVLVVVAAVVVAVVVGGGSGGATAACDTLSLPDAAAMEALRNLSSWLAG